MQLDGSQFYFAAESGLVLLKAKRPQPHCQVHDSALSGSITSSTVSAALSIEL